MTRNGRIALDRCSTTLDEFWQSLDYTIFDSEKSKVDAAQQEASVVEDRLVEDRLSGAPESRRSFELINARIGSIGRLRMSSASEGRNISPSPLSFVAGESLENVIKRESVDTPTSLKIKEEQLDDYERLIDNVNNDRNNKQISNSCSSSGSSSNNSNLRNNLMSSSTTPVVVTSTIPKSLSFTNEFLDYAVKSERTGSVSSTSSLQHLRLTHQQHQQHQTDTSMSIAHLLGPSAAAAATSTTQTASNNFQLSHTQESRDSGISIKSESINDNDALLMHQLPQELSDSIYDEFLDEIERTWLHFRPKTPPLSPSAPPTTDTTFCTSDMLTYDTDCIDTLSRLTSGPFNVELQTLEGQLPQNVFADNEESVFVTTEPIVLDTLMSETLMNRVDKGKSYNFQSVLNKIL